MIGGTGIISTAVCDEMVNRGINLTVMNRGTHNDILDDRIKTIVCDVNDEDAVNKALQDKDYDSIIDWIAFTEDDIERDIRLFKGKTDQFIFISSASAYQKPLPYIPITEDVPLDNPYWQYSKNKQLCEERLMKAHDETFNVTIIRPSHTYNEKMMIMQLKSHQKPFGIFKRIQEDKPIILPDEGLNLWTITYNKDFAKGFVDVVGNEKTYGEIYHLTSNTAYTWERIIEMYYKAFDKTPNLVYVPMDALLKVFPEFEGELKGDKDKSTTFDNTKIQSVAPHYSSGTHYWEIAPKVVEYYLDHPELQTYDEAFEEQYDALVERFQKKDE